MCIHNIMSTNRILEARFNENQWREVEKLRRKYGIKTATKLIRRLVEEALNLSIADARRKQVPLPAEYLSVHDFWQAYRKKLKSEKRVKRKNMKMKTNVS